MKILHIIDTIGLGGAQSVVKGIFESYKDNQDLFLYALRERSIRYEIDHTNVWVFPDRKKFSLKPLTPLKKLIEKENIEMLHCHLFRSQVFGYLLKKIYFPRITLIFHEHAEIFENNMMFNSFLKIARHRIDFTLACSHAAKQHLVKRAGIAENRIEVLHNFVDLDKFNRKNIKWSIDKAKEKLGIKKDDIVVGFAGRLIKRKGWEEFIAAADILQKKGVSLKFLIAGEGADKEKLLKLIERYRLKNSLIYIGYISDMVWFYSLLNCFVIPSHYEPMGITEIEAQAMHIPVIAANVEGLNEIIKHRENGLLFEPKNAKDLAEKIHLLFEYDQLRSQIIQNASKTVQNHALPRYNHKLSQIYNTII